MARTIGSDQMERRHRELMKSMHSLNSLYVLLCPPKKLESSSVKQARMWQIFEMKLVSKLASVKWSRVCMTVFSRSLVD